MKEENIYTVYKHTNLKNGKQYIGVSSNPKRRWNHGIGYYSNPKMLPDLLATDWDTDWSHEILCELENKDDALKVETMLISLFNTVESGYNSSLFGAHSCKHTDESKKKMSESHGIFGVLQFSKTGEFIAEYPSLMEASRATECNVSNICHCCKGRLKSTGGFIWKVKG